VIQRNIVKAKTFFNQSVARVRDVSFSRVFVDSVREKFLTDISISKTKTPTWMLFARETLRNPRSMGTLWTSSPWLAQAIANFVPKPESGIVVELGGGTGVVTEALLQHGISPERLVSIELSATLVDCLRRRCPQIRIIKGDARHLCDLLGNDCQRVSTIVSSLPFRSLPPIIGHSIIKQIDKVLPKGGLLIQYTYDLTGRGLNLPHNFHHQFHKVVWSNFPPARVDVYKYKP
jgi:phospholipid N-methyltransferase